MKPLQLALLLVLLLTLAGTPVRAQAPATERVPILLDTDIGTDIDDAFALGFILGSHELDLRGVTSVGADAHKRAMMLCRFLTVTGRRHTGVAVGQGPQPPRPITGQHQYYYHPDVLFDRTRKPEKLSAVDFLYARLKAQPGRITVLAAGPLTNIARLLSEKSDARALIKQVVLVEANLKLDAPAAKTVFASGLPLVVVPTETTAGLRLTPADVSRGFSPGTPLSRQVQTLYQLWDQAEPPLADVFAAALCFNEDFARLSEQALTVDDGGKLVVGQGRPNARVVAEVKPGDFVRWYVERMAGLLPPERSPVALVERGGMPHRVHVGEDYNTDIERRWWMAGKAETVNLPPGSSRACRGVLTHDFDDLLMISRRMYTAVIFNPVPGPPMGQNTRLSFRCWLKGTDTLRVQIYSLTNGYHRQLVVKGLPQGKWQQATVDMTRARRPDGTGGPLGENERIDDIQFYADPDAELLIDDVVLYDAAAPNEPRPFPKRVIFAANFDTGKQGKEWPGTFEIVPEQGYFWRAAKSVPVEGQRDPVLRLNLRGERALGPRTHLSFRYRLGGTDKVRIRLMNSATGDTVATDLNGLAAGTWAQATARFDTSKGRPRIDEVHFRLPAGAEMLIDDVLLYEPAD